MTHKHKDTIDLKFLINELRKNILTYSLFTALSLGIAFLYNKFTIPTFTIASSIIINEEQNSFEKATSASSNDGRFLSAQKNFANELMVLQSKPLIQEALNQLDLTISYYKKENLNFIELYKESPFIVLLNTEHRQAVSCPFDIVINNPESFRISCKEEVEKLFRFSANQPMLVDSEINIDQVGYFGETIEHDLFSFTLILNPDFNINELRDNAYRFSINSPPDLLHSYKTNLSVQPSDMESTVIDLEIDTKVPAKTMDFLNSLTNSYISLDQQKKVFLSQKAIDFIDQQLSMVSDSLRKSEEELQQFRSGNQVLDLSFQANQVFEELKTLENEKANMLVNQEYFTYLSDYFHQNQEYSDLIAPTGMGVEDPLLNNLIKELIQLNAEKTSLIQGNQEKSPYLKGINIRIENLRKMISENVEFLQSTGDIKIKDLQSRINALNAQINKLPQTERELLGMKRQFELNDAMYTYLLERRTEAEISKSSYQSDAEILEPANIKGNEPVAPKKALIFGIAFFMGLFIPFTILRLKDMFRGYFKTTQEIKRSFPELPIIAEVTQNNSSLTDVVRRYPNFYTSECFRKINLRLPTFLSENKTGTNVITLTSTVTKEGKTFTALNLAITLASTNKKTVLLDFDLRKKSDYVVLGISDGAGISEYLTNQSSLSDIIRSSNQKNLDVVLSGDLHESPGQILDPDAIEKLLNKLKEIYEYILIDSPPLGVFPDGLILLRLSDLRLLIMRVNYTPKKESGQVIEDLSMEKLTDKLAILLNFTPFEMKKKYGYDYYKA